MIQHLKKKLLSSACRKVIIIEITEFNDNDDAIFNIKASYLQHTNKQILVTENFQSSDIQQLSKWIITNDKKSIPVLLVIDGNKVLNKLISGNSTDSSELLNRIIPSATTNDFLIQKYLSEHNDMFVSICRINYVEDIINKLSFLESRIINLSIGPFALFEHYKSICPKTVHDGYHITTDYFQLVFSENSLVRYNTIDNRMNNTSAIHFGTEKISSDYALAISEGISFFIDPLSTQEISYEKTINRKRELAFKVYSKFSAIIFSAVLFLLLGTSAIFYTIYSSRYNYQLELKNEYQSILASIKTSNENQIKQNEVIQNYGITQGGRVAYFADQITRTTPNDIYINKLNIFPINRSGIDIDETIENNRIVISGNSYSSADVVDWVNNLKKYDWVSSITISQYKQDNIEQIGSFSIEIIKK